MWLTLIDGIAPRDDRPAVIELTDGLVIGRGGAVVLDSSAYPGLISHSHATVRLHPNGVMIENHGLNKTRLENRGATLKPRNLAIGQLGTITEECLIIFGSTGSREEFVYRATSCVAVPPAVSSSSATAAASSGVADDSCGTRKRSVHAMMAAEEERVEAIAASLGVSGEVGVSGTNAAAPATEDVPSGSVRVRSLEGVLVLWSREAARRSGTLLDWLEMCDDEAVFPATTIGTASLRLLASLCEVDDEGRSCVAHGHDLASAPPLRALGGDAAELISLINASHFLDVPTVLRAAANVLASTHLEGKSAGELSRVLGVWRSDLITEARAASQAAALAEPAFQPDGEDAGIGAGEAGSGASETAALITALSSEEMTLGTAHGTALGGSAWATFANDDALQEALHAADDPTLCELKAVSATWRAHARRVLCARLSGAVPEGLLPAPALPGMAASERSSHAEAPTPRPLPSRYRDITDLDVERLWSLRRPWDAARAGRLLPNLRRLHGAGFVVDVAAVHALSADALRYAVVHDTPSLINSTPRFGDDVVHALSGCFRGGDGVLPYELVVGAIACAANLPVMGLDVPALRAGAVESLDVRALHPDAFTLLAHLLPATSAVQRIDFATNTSVSRLLTEPPEIEVCIGAPTDLSSVHARRKEWQRRHSYYLLFEALRASTSLRALDLSSTFSFGRVPKTSSLQWVVQLLQGHGSLRSLYLASNKLRAPGMQVLADALKDSCSLTLLDLRHNELGAAGAAHVASVLAAPASVLISLDLSSNELSDGASSSAAARATLDAAAVPKMKVPELKAALQARGIDSSGKRAELVGLLTAAMHEDAATQATAAAAVGDAALAQMAKALKANRTLTSLNLRGNGIRAQSAHHLATALAVNTTLTSLNMRVNALDEPAKAALRAAARDGLALEL